MPDELALMINTTNPDVLTWALAHRVRLVLLVGRGGVLSRYDVDTGSRHFVDAESHDTK